MNPTRRNKLCIYAEDLGVYTSSTPSRDMLRELMCLRPNDHFIFLFGKDGEKADWAQTYLQSLPQNRISVHTMKWSRRETNIRNLLGLSHIERDTLPHADIYLRFDAGGLGPQGTPLIDLIADLSALKREYSSMPWHGRALFKRSLEETYRLSAATVVISQATAEAVKDHRPTMSDKLHLIPNGIGDEWHQVGTTDAAMIENYWIWYGQVTPRKNLLNLLVGYQRLLASTTNIEIPKIRLIALASTERYKLECQIKSLRLQDHVNFHDPRPLVDLITEVKSSKGLLFPSYYEGFGMPIIEAMTCGRPVLTSNVTSMPEIAGGHAVLCDPNDPTSIRTALSAMLSPDQDTTQARALRRLHAQRYTVHNAARAYSDLIDAVITKHSPAR